MSVGGDFLRLSRHRMRLPMGGCLFFLLWAVSIHWGQSDFRAVNSVILGSARVRLPRHFIANIKPASRHENKKKLRVGAAADPDSKFNQAII